LLFFFVFQRVFVFSASIDIYIRINYHFLTFFLSVGGGPPSARFAPLAQASSYATVYRGVCN